VNNCRFFGNVQPAFFSEFSNSSGSVAERREFSTLLQFRKILLRTVNCIGVLHFVVNCQKVQCSTQIEGDSS